MNRGFSCPVCGYPELEEEPYAPGCGGSYEICPSCGFEYGFTDDDQGETFASWRAKWIAGGMRWRAGPEEPPPVGWDPAAQVASLGDTRDGA